MSRLESPDMQLVELLRRSDGPTDEDMRRVREAVGLQVAAGAAASTALLAAHATWRARFGTLGAWGKGLLVVSSLIGVGIGIAFYAKPESVLLGAPRTPQPAVQPGEALPKGIVPGVTAQSPNTGTETGHASDAATAKAENLGLPDPSVRGRVSSSKATARGSTSTLEAELKILGRAQSALKGGQAGEALLALDEHARRFPNGVLALERSGVRTVALCQSGRLAEGRAAARSYLRLVPNSVLSKRIRVACHLADE